MQLNKKQFAAVPPKTSPDAVPVVTNSTTNQEKTRQQLADGFMPPAVPEVDNVYPRSLVAEAGRKDALSGPSIRRR